MPHEASRTYPRAGLTQSILAAAIRVHDALEPGLLEKPCRVCLAHALRWAGHRVTLEASLDILEDVQARSRGVHGATSDQARYGRGRPATHVRDAEAPAAHGRAALALRARAAGQGLVRWVEILAPAPR